MKSYEFSDQNGSAEYRKEKEGMYISHVTGFIFLLLAVCLSVLVGLIVHFASPGQLVCNCQNAQPEVPELTPEELRGKCMDMIKGGDVEICSSCPTTTSKTSATWTTVTKTPQTMSTTTSMPTTTQAPIINYRLPRSIKPHHYVLELQPEIYGSNSSLFTFNGTVKITFNVTEPTSNITLHRKDVNVDNSSLTLTSTSGSTPSITGVSNDDIREFYILHLDGDLQAGRSYDVMLNFHGDMRTDGSGLYLSSYTSDDNETVYLATTQFEAPEARKAFPCFDEPALKATFDITLVRKNNTGRNYRSLSNTEAIGHEQRGDYVADIFATTPVMPTYLLAFIVCDFKHVENVTSNVTYRTLSRPNAIQYTNRAQEYGLKLFDWFEANFDPVYPIPKLDNIAIPDFVSGAMENWGLITYRENLLYIPGVSTANNDAWAVEVIAHEITHQWFGNVVSPKWWWWLWLNEAFASFWDFHSVEVLYPLRRATEQFIVQSMHYALVVDGRQSAHPLTNDAESRKEVDSIFDTITYSKGAAIVRMMHFTMGNDLFIKGLNRYLIRHQYSVAEHQDLWNALTEEADAEGTPINMTDIMDPWVTQMNFPLVTVTVQGPGTIHIRQERFLNNMSSNTTGDTAPYNYQWTIPITFASNLNTTNFAKTYTYNDIEWLHHSQKEKTVSSPIIPDPASTDNWVLVNVNEYGFYRVNYEERNWMALVKQLERDRTVISATSRAQITNDAWVLQRTGLVPLKVALRTWNFLKDETDYVPWRAFARDIGYVDAMLERSDLYGAFKEYMRQATTKTYLHYRMNIDDTTQNIDIFQIARGSNYACAYGVPECVQDSLDLLHNWMNDTEKNRVHPNVQAVVMCNGVRHGGMKEWNFVYDLYWNSYVSGIRNNALQGISCATSAWLVERMLNMAFDETKIRSANARLLISYITQRPYAKEIIMNLLKQHYELINKEFSSASISTLIADASYGHNTEFRLEQWKTLANLTADISAFKSPISSAIRNTETNIKWMKDNRDTIVDWLTETGFGSYLP